MQDPKRGRAYDAVAFIYQHSPGRSWQRLNTALAETLRAAITAHLTFEVDDFDAMYSRMSGHYWMGNSCGSCPGERFYVHAVDVDHTPACLSFEKHAGRPPALWVEDVKTPNRLRIGSDFTWEGLRVSVTNMTEDHLIACYYENRVDHHDETRVGDGFYLDREYREITKIDRPGAHRANGIKITLGKVLIDNRKPTKRFKIAYPELLETRKHFDAMRKEAILTINGCVAELALGFSSARLSKKPWRPYDKTELSAAIAAKYKALKEPS